MRTFRYLALWAVVTVLATSVGVLAISIVGEQIRARSVTDLLEAAPVPPTTPPATTPAVTTEPPAPRPEVVTSLAGVVTVLCVGDVAQLVSVVANPGWQTLGSSETNRTVQVAFSDSSTVEDVGVSCTAGTAVPATAVRAPDPPPSAAPQADPGPASTPPTQPPPAPAPSPEEDGSDGGGSGDEDSSGDGGGGEGGEGDGEEDGG